MPYKSEKIPIAGGKYDRRIKLTMLQREAIRELREKYGVSYQKIADQFSVSKRLVIFICNPDMEERAKEQYRQHRKDGRYYKGGEQWAETIREHRRYKHELNKKGLI